MMVVSYGFGQRYYKVPYDLGIFLLSIASAVVLWAASVYIDGWIGQTAVRHIVHTGLLLAFPAIVWLFLRRKSLKFA
jgi:hypothetical protein